MLNFNIADNLISILLRLVFSFFDRCPLLRLVGLKTITSTLVGM